jgi:hypothetical protein
MNATVLFRSPEAEAQGVGALALAQRADGRLTATRDGEIRIVRVCLTFPWSEPGRFVSLRDDDDEEFALVADAGDLDPSSRSALEEALVIAGFVLDVTRVISIEEEVEVRFWQVDTRQGPRSFQTRLDDWPRVLPLGGLLVRDVAGDLYRVADPDALDARSREVLWAFVD